MSSPVIDRTAYNALVDDSGGGTDGTVWSKSNVKDTLDAVDTLAGKLDTVGSQLDVTVTGTQNDYNPGTGVLVRWNGASQLTLNGIVPRAGGVGDLRVFYNVSTGFGMFFAHQSTGSSAANRLILPTSQGQWVGPGGAIGFTYDITNSRWRVSFLVPGAAIAFTPTYTSSGGGTPTYSIQFGRFIQNGINVHANGRITLSGFGTLIAGNVILGGLPLNCDPTANHFSVGAFWWNAFATAIVNLVGLANPNSIANGINLYAATAAVTGLSTSLLTTAITGSGCDIVFSCDYIAAP